MYVLVRMCNLYRKTVSVFIDTRPVGALVWSASFFKRTHLSFCSTVCIPVKTKNAGIYYHGRVYLHVKYTLHYV